MNDKPPTAKKANPGGIRMMSPKRLVMRATSKTVLFLSAEKT